METQISTDTYKIALTDIKADSLDFTAHLSRTYLMSTPAAKDCPSDISGLIDDLSDFEINGNDEIVFKFSVYDNCLRYFVPANHIGGHDLIDDLIDAIYSYGQPIVDFIDSHCKLHGLDFYPNHDEQ